MARTAPAPLAASVGSPALPTARGPLSAALARVLRTPPAASVAGLPGVPADTDPYGEDLHLALQLCYELHYRGWAGVDDAWEWQPDLLRTRAAAEEVFLRALRRDAAGGDDVHAELDALLVRPPRGSGVAGRLAETGTWRRMREYLVHRSIYQLKESDPQAWVLPRLQGQAKASVAAVEFDEFGAGHGDRVHARLYADLLDGAGLDPGYLGHLDVVPAPALALVNMMSLFGLHRGLRGALVGHFAHVETTSPPGAQTMVAALRRLEADERCVRFYAEHVEADAVHEQVLRHDVVQDLLDTSPELAADMAFGVRVTGLLEDRLAAHILDAWDSGRSSLLRPLP